MAKKKQAIVKFTNNLLDKDYSDLSVVDNRFWYGTLALVAEKQDTHIEMSVDEFMAMVGVPESKGAPYARELLFNMAQKIQGKTAFIEKSEDGKETLRWFFDECSVNLNTRRIELKTNEKYLKAVNDFVNNFTKFSLEQYVDLPTKGAQELFVMVQRDKYKKDVFISIKELKRRLGKESERDRDITNRVVKPAVSLFKYNNSFGEDFEFQKVYEGRKLIGYRFLFGDEMPKQIDEDTPW